MKTVVVEVVASAAAAAVVTVVGEVATQQIVNDFPLGPSYMCVCVFVYVCVFL